MLCVNLIPCDPNRSSSTDSSMVTYQKNLLSLLISPWFLSFFFFFLFFHYFSSVHLFNKYKLLITALPASLWAWRWDDDMYCSLLCHLCCWYRVTEQALTFTLVHGSDAEVLRNCDARYGLCLDHLPVDYLVLSLCLVPLLNVFLCLPWGISFSIMGIIGRTLLDWA